MRYDGWKETRLIDVIDINPRTPLRKGTLAKKVSMQHVAEFTRKIQSYEIAEFTSGSKFKNGDTLLARITPCLENGKTAYVDILEDNEIAFGSTEFIVLRAKEGITDSKFVYYLAISPEFRNIAIKSMTGSSGRQRVQSDVLANTVICLPPLQEQKRIANLLSAIDDKIELNNEMNKTLEELAQMLFKRWFVDFEFPNENGEPYKSSGGKFVESELGMIPEGWKVVTGDDVFSSASGYSYKGKELRPSTDAMVTIKNFQRSGGFKVDGLKEIVISDKVKPHHYVQVGDVVVAHTDLTQNADIIGNPVLIHSNGGYKNLIISMDTVKVTSKDGSLSNPLIYLILKDNRFKNYALGYTNGTTVLHLSKSAIKNYKFPIPKDKLLIERLESIINPIFKQISIRYTENESLSELRDTLLPKLMSGEIRVPDAEREVEVCLQKSS